MTGDIIMIMLFTVSGQTGEKLYRETCLQGRSYTGKPVFRGEVIQGNLSSGEKLYRETCLQGRSYTGKPVFRGEVIQGNLSSGEKLYRETCLQGTS